MIAFQKSINFIDTTNKIIIIGGGISGAATAHSLAIRGYKVTLYEKSNALATGGSGNYQAILHGTFHGNYIPLTELHFLGMRYSIELIKSLLDEDIDYQQSGMMQLFPDEFSVNKAFTAIHKNYETFKHKYLGKLPNNTLQEFCQLVNPNQLSFSCNAKHALYFPHHIWLHPQNLISKLTNHPNIEIILNTDITEINLIEKQNNHIWQLKSIEKFIDESKILILCNAHLANQFIYTQNLNLLKTRGQTTKIKGQTSLKMPLSKDSYILPSSKDGYFTIGATFKPNNVSTTLNALDDLENIESISKFFPQIKKFERNMCGGHAAIRCSTQDYLPLVGPIAKYDEFIKANAKLALDKNLKITQECSNLPGLYLNIAHGAKGFITAPIAGEIIAYIINNESNYLNDKLLKKLSPNRVYINKIIKAVNKSL